MTSNEPSPAVLSISRYMKVASLAIFILIGCIGGWAIATNIAGAIVANGAFVVDSHVKTIQHSTGGIVGEILVNEGQRVNVGDILMRLDGTQADANLTMIKKRLNEFSVKLSRLKAERDDLPNIAFSSEILAMEDDLEIMEAIQDERQLFSFRKTVRTGLKEQLTERIIGYENEIVGLRAQETAYDRGLVVLEAELIDLRGLHKKGFVPVRRLNALEREAATLEGATGEAIASKARALGQIAETKLQILQIEQDLKSEVTAEIREIQGQVGEFNARKIVAEDTMQRIEIVAPQEGIIHQLSSHTIGGVISPGDQIMQIVPNSDKLVLEVQIAPQDIDQIWLGQNAVLRLSAFNQRTTPQVNGKVDRIGADLIQDQITGLSFYTIRITVAISEMEALGSLSVIPGMPAEAFIQTEERTVLSYLLKPLSDQINRAFREE